MKLFRLIHLVLGLPILAGTAVAQSNTITVNLANSWIVNQDASSSTCFSHMTIPGAGDDELNVTALSVTDEGPGNQTQATVIGVRSPSSTVPMSASTSCSSFGFKSLVWNGSGTGTAAATADSVASGQLPPMTKINMSGSAQHTINIGIFTGGPVVSSTSSAVVTAPQVVGGGLGALNRLVLTQGPPVGQNVAALGYFYSSFGDAAASATLKKGDSAFFVTNVLVSATVNLF